MLVLAHAYALGIDLDQLGQGVLQAAGDGDGTTDGDIEIRELLGGEFGGGVDRGACLAHHYLLRLGGGVALEQIAHQAVGLPGGGAVAYADELDLVLLAQLAQGLEALVNLALGFERVDGGVIDQLAGGIHHGYLDPGADAGIQPHGAAHAGRRCHQQILEVHGEHLDRLVLCRFADAADKLGFHLQGELDLPGPAHHPLQPLVGRTALQIELEVMGDDPFARAGTLIVTGDQRQVEDPLVAAAQHGQHPVGGGLVQGLVVLEVVLELGPFLLLACHHASPQGGVLPQVVPQLLQQIGLLGEAFHQDIAGAVEGGLAVGDAVVTVEKGGCCLLGILHRIGEQQVGQRLQPSFDGHLPLGATLGLVGEIEIFEPGLAVGTVQLARQLRGQLALLLNGAKDHLAAIFQFTQIAEAALQGTQLTVVQTAGHLLAITGDKGNGRAFIQQAHGGLHLFRAGIQLTGNLSLNYMAVHLGSLWSGPGQQASAGLCRRAGGLPWRYSRYQPSRCRAGRCTPCGAGFEHYMRSTLGMPPRARAPA